MARITRVQERIVDLSRTISGSRGLGEADAAGLMEDDNPFDLSDGLRWYLLDAQEEKPGAPSTPGLGKTTVAAANVDVRGSVSRPVKKKASDLNRVEETLSKSLESRRSSTTSKKSGQQVAGLGIGGSNEGVRPGSRASSALQRQSLDQQPEAQNEASTIQQQDEEVRRDLLWGP